MRSTSPEIIDDVTVAKGQAGAFVDARRLRSEDYVAEQLHQTTGSLGVYHARKW